MSIKQLWIIIVCLCGVAALADAQQQLGNAGDTLAFIKMTIKNVDDTPYANQTVALRSNKGRVIKVKTDAKGFVRATVPYDDIYGVYCGDHRCRDSVTVEKFPYITYEFKGFSQQALVLNFICKSPSGKPLDGEVLELENEKGVRQSVTMDKDGKAKVILPMEAFKIHAQYLPYVHSVKGDPQYEQHIINLPMSWVGTKEMKRRAFLADSLARERKLEIMRYWDRLASEPDSFIAKDLEIPMLDDTAMMRRLVQSKAKVYKAKHADDPKFFEKNRKTVLAALTRMSPILANNPIIVTDVTGSMYPYMEQVMLWHALNFMNGKTSKYVFFNDGDVTPDDKKIIGKTGGLYFCQGTIKDLNVVINTLVKSANAGGGGDAEENDMEAVLAAHSKGTKGTESIILIADNFSPVRDFELLSKVKVPVHVILCGLDQPYTPSICPYAKKYEHINEQYLEIARKTGGSVHTILEDILDIAKKKEGEELVLDGTRYLLQNGRFVFQTRL